MRVTVDDVARRAGVSRATAARVLGGYAGPFSRAREPVLRSAAEIGYIPNRLARGLASRRSHRLGVLLPDLENLFFARVFRGIETAAMVAGYSVLLAHTSEDQTREYALLADMLAERVEGIIVAPAVGCSDLRSCPVPVVFVDRHPDAPSWPWVSSDNRQASAQATRHLIERGYRRITPIANLPRLSTVTDRLQGCRDAMSDRANLEPVHITSSHRLQEMSAEVHRYLDAARPEAVIALDSVIGMAVMMAARRLDLGLGDRFGLVVYDDEPWMTLVEPSITTVEQPALAMGEQAAQMLLALIAGTEVPTPVQLAATLHMRASTAPHI